MNRDQNGRFAAQEASYGYYSKLLKQPFESLAELKAAEDAYKKEHAKELAEKEARSEDLKKIEAAANAYLELTRSNAKAREEMQIKEQKAYKAYRDTLTEFAAKHNGYHLTYRNNGNNVEFQIEDVRSNAVEKYLRDMKHQQEQMQRFFDSFWF